MREAKRSGSGATDINKGPFFERLQFLLAYTVEGGSVKSISHQIYLK